MKKIYFLLNHLENSNGVTQVAIGMANALAQRDDVEVTLAFLFRYDKEVARRISKRVKLKKCFGFYFRGFSKIVNCLPKKFLYRMVCPDHYDIEIGFCYSLPTQIMAASSNRKAVHIAWMHGYDDGLTLKREYLKFDKIICVSKVNAERLGKELNYAVPVKYCYNLVNDERVETLGRERISLISHPVMQFVTVGRLSPEKGFMRLLDCVERLKEDGYSFHLWVIGDGPQSDKLREKVENRELKDFVCLAGEQSNPYKFISKADVFICSSISEGCSTACNEAVILGIPVLTTAVSGGEEIVGLAQAGSVVGLDTESLYKGMKEILDDPACVQQWKKTLNTTRENFSYAERVKRLVQVLELDGER